MLSNFAGSDVTHASTRAGHTVASIAPQFTDSRFRFNRSPGKPGGNRRAPKGQGGGHRITLRVIPILILLLATTLLAPLSFGQGYNAYQKTIFSATGSGSSIHESSVIAYHELFWTKSGTVSTCTIALDSSPDGTSWTAGGIITGQTCTTNGNSAVVAASANYVRATLTALSGGGTVTIVYEGWVNNPGSAGGGTINPTNGLVPVRSNSTTFADSPLTINAGNVINSGTERAIAFGAGTAVNQGAGIVNAFQLPSVLGAGNTYGGAPWSLSQNSAVFGGFTDNALVFGYNAGQAMGAIVAGKPVMGYQTEVDYFDGVNHFMEHHLDYTTDNISYHRPFAISTYLTDGTRTNVSVRIGHHSASLFGVSSESADGFTATPLLNVAANGDVLFGADGSGSIGQDTDLRPTNVNVKTLVKVPRFELNGDRFVVKASNADSVIDIFATSHKIRFSPDQADGVLSFQDNTGSDVLTMTMPTGVFNLQNTNGSGNAITQLSLSAGTNQASNNMTQWKNGSGAVTTSVASDATFSTAKLNTNTNCSNNGTAANPSVVTCVAASAGSFSCATNASTGTCQVNTTAVTANSQIFIQEDDSLGSRLGVTCNTNNISPTTAPVAARSAGASFTINLGTISVNPECFSYFIVN